MSQQAAIRKRISFTPIMLTSKSIRPIDRSNYELLRNQRKISCLVKTRDDFTSYVFRDNHHLSRQASPSELVDGVRQYERSAGRTAEDEHYKQLMRKMTSPTVVKVEFQRQLSGNRQKNLEKVNGSKDGEYNHTDKEELSRLLNLKNSKNLEQYNKIVKVGQTKTVAYKTQKESDNGWKKYYINIKKVRPLLKKQNNLSLLLSQKIHLVHEVQQSSPSKAKEQMQELIKFKSASPPRSKSKCETLIQNKKKVEIQQHSTEDIIRCDTLKKIEHDIMNRKLVHKKEFFVFGLSQAVNKSNEAQIKTKFQLYKDFLFRINYTNGLYVFSRDQCERPLKFYVGFGNNSALIKGIIKRRYWWQVTDKISDDTNFVWTQLKIADFFKDQICNKFNQKSVITKTSSFFQNSSKQLQNEAANAAIMKGNDLMLWQRYKQKNIKIQQKGFESALLKRVGSLLKRKKIAVIQSSLKLKVQNHFQSNYYLGNKKALFYSLRLYYKIQDIDPFTKIPLTFHITESLADPQFQRFLGEFQAQNEKKKTDKEFRNIWIVKPGELTNRGRGITVCSTLDQIKNRLKAKQRNANGSVRSFIIQKYIQRPLLYQRRKFDIRHYMAISCVNGKMKGYWYAEGYIRTTSSQYNIKNTKDLFTHLTNDAVQKNGQDYGKYQKGNKLSYQEFQKYLSYSLGMDVDFNGQILTKMKQLATDCIKATYFLLDAERKEHNFQLFGLDFMLDESLNVYLIEVNTNPCLQTSCPLLTKIITPLIQNLFKLCLDPLFPPPVQWPAQRKYYLGQNALEENKFSLVFDENVEGSQLQDMYKNADKMDARMGDIFEQEEQYCDEQKEWNDDEQTKK